jgi:hypothetical protein
VQAHLAAQATKGKESQQRRRKQKLNIMKMMYDRGYSQQEVTDLYRFVDWVLTLPPDLAEPFKTDLIVYEGKKNMPYISEIELPLVEFTLLLLQLNRQESIDRFANAKF